MEPSIYAIQVDGVLLLVLESEGSETNNELCRFAALAVCRVLVSRAFLLNVARLLSLVRSLSLSLVVCSSRRLQCRQLELGSGEAGLWRCGERMKKRRRDSGGEEEEGRSGKRQRAVAAVFDGVVAYVVPHSIGKVQLAAFVRNLSARGTLRMS